MMDISIIMITARDDHAILGCPEIHIFEPLIKSLNKQTFKNFELIIVDSLHKWRDKTPLDEATFPIKHIPPKDCIWYDLGMWHATNDFNTGILHSDGELLIKIDDCMELHSENHLEKTWDWYNKGFTPLQTYTYYFKGEQAIFRPGLADEIISEGTFSDWGKQLLVGNWPKNYEIGDKIRDTRIDHVGAKTKITTHEWYYGVSAVTLNDALSVNGYDENESGCRGLSDIDFGLRLEMHGVAPFLLDKDLLLIEHFHDDLSKKVITKHVHFRNSRALYYLNKTRRKIRANITPLTEEEIEFIREQTFHPTIDEINDPTDQRHIIEESEYWFDFWTKNMSTFNLREMRLEI